MASRCISSRHSWSDEVVTCIWDLTGVFVVLWNFRRVIISRVVLKEGVWLTGLSPSSFRWWHSSPLVVLIAASFVQTSSKPESVTDWMASWTMWVIHWILNEGKVFTSSELVNLSVFLLFSQTAPIWVLNCCRFSSVSKLVHWFELWSSFVNVTLMF